MLRKLLFENGYQMIFFYGCIEEKGKTKGTTIFYKSDIGW